MQSSLLAILSLRFEDPDLEAKFASEYTDRVVNQMRFALVLGSVFMLGDAAVDFGFDPEQSFRANMLRIFGVPPVLALSLALTYWQRFRNYLELYCTVVFLAVSAGLFWAMRLLEIDGGMGFSSWVGPLNYTFVMIFLFLILGIRFLLALPTAIVATVLFVSLAESTLDHASSRSVQHLYHTGTVFLLSAFLGYWRELYVRRRFQADTELAVQRAKTDEMLFQQIPARIVDQLRHRPPPIAESFAEVTVLFADIAEFTQLATRISPEHLLEVLDRVFAGLDRAVEVHGLEKVKTIGDAYMAVCHSGSDGPNGAERSLECAQEWTSVARDVAEETGLPIALRIGIHTGPVIGGVIGSQRWSYDYWGDTVNVASRIENAAEPGTILVSEATYWRARNSAELEQVGPIALKGHPDVTCYTFIEPVESG